MRFSPSLFRQILRRYLTRVILGIVIAEVAAQGPQSQDPLSVQGRLFIGSTLQEYVAL